ncbi:MAG TPA: alpha/beta hydrolase [Caulobacteraceae bacterium]|jgi:pimeloyl-ACP methyl ester carboxylesterase|nr:alpha/beta hydrolase [Caulobacteraceae bacterium]
MNLRCEGGGSPTVLLDAGWAGDSMAWTRVAALESGRRRVCAVDRAGMGFSDPGPLPRDAAAIARDLGRLLNSAHLHGPFILVGHSAGALYMLTFAAGRPHQIAGIVLVDPTVPHGDRRYSELLGPGVGSLEPLIERSTRCLEASRHHALPSADAALARCTPSRRPGEPDQQYRVELAQSLRPSLWETQLSEVSTLESASSDEAEAAGPSLARTPLIVLTAADSNAGLPPAARAIVDGITRRWHGEMAKVSSRGVWRLVPGSSHLMPIDRPDAIVEAIDQIGRSPAQ